MKGLVTIALTGAVLAVSPASGQSMDHSMHRMPMPAPPKRPVAKPKPAKPVAAKPGRDRPVAAKRASAKPAAPKRTITSPAPQRTGQPTLAACPPDHAAMGHCTSTTASAPASQATAPSGTALPAGNAPAPAAPEPDYADRIWGRDAMAPTRKAMRREHGGMTMSQIMLDQAEYRVRDGTDGIHWDAEGWFGGDIDRLVLKTEGDADVGSRIDDAEIQALYSRAVGPYFNLQAGIRHDIRPRPSRTHATIGFEGLAPYWFEVEGALFLSDRGDVSARLEGYYDQRLTQRLILQPRAEVNLSAQDIAATGTGSGLTDAEIGLRLRYEIAREFAPYVGVAWDRKFGDTARFARAAGDDAANTSLVAGIRAWF